VGVCDAAAREVPLLAARAGVRIYLAGLLAVVAALGCYHVNDGDLGFHLATGREILRAGRIPTHNVLSFTEPDHVWLLHQGLPALLFELLWRHTGLAGLMALKLLLLMGTWALVFGAALALGASAPWAVLCSLCAAAASAFRFELRPYLFTHLTLAWTLFALARWARAAPRALPLSAALALALGAQLHAGALDSAIVLGCFALGCALELPLARLLGRSALSPSGLRAAGAVALAALLGLGAAAALLSIYHPLGVRVLSVPFQMATHAYWSDHVVEFRRPDRLPFAPLAGYWLWLALSGVALVLGLRLRRMHAGWLLMVVAYACASLAFVRMAYAFALISVPLVAAVATGLFGATVRRALPLFALLASLALGFVYRDHTPGIGLTSWTWPRAAIGFMRAHAVAGPAFVSDAWAGPFLGELYPEQRVFFDNRLEAYSDGFARDVYQRVRYGAPGWDALLDRYDVQLVLLRYATPGEARRSPGHVSLRQQLVLDARYRLVYFDDDGELFVRVDGPNRALAEQRGIPGVDPDRRAFVGPPRHAAQALLRAAEAEMRSITALGLLALALADAGDMEHARALGVELQARAPDDPFVRGLSRWLAQ